VCGMMCGMCGMRRAVGEQLGRGSADEARRAIDPATNFAAASRCVGAIMSCAGAVQGWNELLAAIWMLVD